MNFLKNYFSTLCFIGFAYFLYTHSAFHTDFINQTHTLIPWNIQLFVPYVFYYIIAAYTILLLPFYYIHPSPSKARLVFSYLWKVIGWNNDFKETEKTAVLAWIVKLFFIPLMITWFTGHVFSLINNIYSSGQSISLFSTEFLVFFNSHFFWTAFSFILFFDVLFFTIWYLIEMPILKNTIKSVEPTLLGWAVCIWCYPPFNGYVTDIIWWYSTDFPSFGNMYIHLFFNITILILMWIYAWASLSLWFKASNLTNRWIISHGPYKYIRHPAYICKNTAWIIGSIPMFIVAFSDASLSLFTVFIWVFWWGFIYYLRAMTEENHLSLDPDYREYKKKVLYKFIPKIW